MNRKGPASRQQWRERAADLAEKSAELAEEFASILERSARRGDSQRRLSPALAERHTAGVERRNAARIRNHQATEGPERVPSLRELAQDEDAQPPRRRRGGLAPPSVWFWAPWLTTRFLSPTPATI